MQKNLVFGAIIFLLVVACVVWLVRVPSPSNTLVVGGIFNLTGAGASWGEASRNGMELAIKEINGKGGVNGKKLVGVYEDSESGAIKAISAFNKLTSADGAKFIVGPNWSDAGLAVAPLADERKIVMVSPSLGLKEFNESSPYLFNTWVHDEILSAYLAEVVYGRGYKNVAVFGANDIFVAAQTAAFKTRYDALGGRISHLYAPTTDVTDMRTELQKAIADPQVEAIVMTTDGTELTVVVARQLRELGSTLPLFNITVDKQKIADCGGNCEGMIFPVSLTPTEEFEAKYRLEYDREVEIGADSAYDAVMMLRDAMEATNSEDPDKVKEYLAGIRTYDGASGVLTSDGKRAFTKPYRLVEVRNGVGVEIQN